MECVVGYADELAVVITGNNSRNEVQIKGSMIRTALMSLCNNNKLQTSTKTQNTSHLSVNWKEHEDR